MIKLNSIIKNIPQALSIYLNQIVYDQKRMGKDITVLSLGEAFFDIPNFKFENLDMQKGYHYSDSQGLPALRKKISCLYQSKYNVKVDYNSEIIISAGSKILSYFAIKSLINKEDEVIVVEPYWLSYTEQIKLSNGRIKVIPFGTKIKDYKNYFTKKTKALIINNPNNPSGLKLDKKSIIKIYKNCLKKNIFLIIDEAYSDFTDKNTFISFGKLFKNKKNLILINSLSKNMGISGWRIGYLISQPNIIKNILKLNQHLITCAPTILQLYIEKYFEKIIDITSGQIKNLLLKKKKILKFLDSNKIKYINGLTTFYILINIDKYSYTSNAFALYLLLKYQISVVPGIAYGKGLSKYIRMSIGSESLERIKEAILTIKKVLINDECDNKLIKSHLKKLNENQ